MCAGADASACARSQHAAADGELDAIRDGRSEADEGNLVYVAATRTLRALFLNRSLTKLLTDARHLLAAQVSCRCMDAAGGSSIQAA